MAGGDKWLAENCSLISTNEKFDLELQATLERDARHQYFGVRLKDYFANPPGQTAHIHLDCAFEHQRNIDEIYVVLREYKEGGQYVFQVERPVRGGKVDLYLTSREPLMTVQAAIMLRAGSSGGARAKVTVVKSLMTSV